MGSVLEISPTVVMIGIVMEISNHAAGLNVLLRLISSLLVGLSGMDRRFLLILILIIIYCLILGLSALYHSSVNGLIPLYS